MEISSFPEDIKKLVIPEPSGRFVYHCLGCGTDWGIDELLYTCPGCNSVLLIEDRDWDRLKKIPGEMWRRIFDYRKMIDVPSMKGIFLFYELIAPVIPLEDVICLGEGHTPVVEANGSLQEWVGLRFFVKNDGQNPSASFKDRGMASAFSFINYAMKKKGMERVLAVCASTGDTSASAALYAAYLGDRVKSVVLLPHGKVTPQQLAQPLGNGATVLEIPGVFDDCMKVVEFLADNYPVALLNSKNAWRIKGQESYSYEIAQAFNYDLENYVIVAPIGNAGNITAILSGFLNLYDLGIITALPQVVGVQSEHANPVYLYYLEPDSKKRRFSPVKVKPSVAQAAMIGNPVSMPRVIYLVDKYRKIAGDESFIVEEVKEQEIMEAMLIANRNGHIVCTQGGEGIAGLRKALRRGAVEKSKTAIVDSTAHILKFLVFQEKYFANNFEPEFEIEVNDALRNFPKLVSPSGLEKTPASGVSLTKAEFDLFVRRTAEEIADLLGIERKKKD